MPRPVTIRWPKRLVTAICEHLISLEPELNRLDARTGDGDTGSTVAAGARGILAQIRSLPLADTPGTLAAIGGILATSMGGSSGVLLSIFFTAAAKSMAGTGNLSSALLAGLERMTFYGGAKPGDRTMVDALDPALRSLGSKWAFGSSPGGPRWCRRHQCNDQSKSRPRILCRRKGPRRGP